jgi:hypothetical protein
MNWKIALALSAFVTLAASAALPGCGGSDDCTRAEEHKAECLPTMSSTGTGDMMMPACAGVTLCQSQCINQYTCQQIAGNDPNLQACLKGCQGK